MCLARGLWRNKAEEIFKVGIIMKQCVFGGGDPGTLGTKSRWQFRDRGGTSFSG